MATGVLCQFCCTVRLERMAAAAKQHEIFSCNSTEVNLCRNLRREICIELRPSKTNKKHVYKLHNFKSSSKFIKEGKLTLSLLSYQVMILLSNVPPARLILFMRTLKVKHTVEDSRVPSRVSKASGSFNISESLFEKLVGGGKCLEKISPLNNNQLKKFSEIKRRQWSSSTGESSYDTNSSPCKFRDYYSQMNNDSSSSTLNYEQRCVVKSILNGKNVFITGGAGTGKSYLMKCLITHLPPSTTFVTASTGIAASQINGTTINTFAGIGTGEACLSKCHELAKRKPFCDNWKRCCCLILDEISMVSADYFSKVESVARLMKNNQRPFGGIQLIVCGDFYQLPPVTRSASTDANTYCFSAPSWDSCIDCCFELKRIHRQKQDNKFSQLLNRLRVGTCDLVMEHQINSTILNEFPDGVIPTMLCTHKAEATSINQKHLAQINAKSRSFLAVDEPSDCSKLLDSLTIVPNNLELKVGCRVMLCCNANVNKGLTNGSTGDIRSFDPVTGYPVVFFNATQQEMVVKPVKFTAKRNQNSTCVRTQVPLTLAWALSIHKSQGLTLDAVQVSVSRAFACGQIYVALSRAKSLALIKVFGFSRCNIDADSRVRSFYNSIQFEDTNQYTSSGSP